MDDGLSFEPSTSIGADNILEDKDIYSWTALFSVADWTQCQVSNITVVVHVCNTVSSMFAVALLVLYQSSH